MHALKKLYFWTILLLSNIGRLLGLFLYSHRLQTYNLHSQKQVRRHRKMLSLLFLNLQKPHDSVVAHQILLGPNIVFHMFNKPIFGSERHETK
jgi:hypothetical protein